MKVIGVTSENSSVGPGHGSQRKIGGRTFKTKRMYKIQTSRTQIPLAIMTEMDMILVFFTMMRKIVVNGGIAIQKVEKKVPINVAAPFPPLKWEKIG